MSVADFMLSFAVFSGTWLMPQDMIYRQFEDAVLGNWTTCNIQGFLFTLGSQCSVGFNAWICVYYLCILKYNMSDERFSRRLEPLMLVVVVGYSLFLTIAVTSLGLIVPTPWDVTCTAARYPWWCYVAENSEECSPRSALGRALFLSNICIFLGAFAFIIVTMFMVCWTFFIEATRLDRYIKSVHHRDSRNIEASQKKWSELKAIFSQAVGYVLAFFICQSFSLLVVLYGAMGKNVRMNKAFQYMHIFGQPIQGLFNCLIFLGHKVYNRRRSNASLTRFQALVQVFTMPKDEPLIFLNNIQIVVNDNEEDIKEESEEDGPEEPELDSNLSNRSSGIILSGNVSSSNQNSVSPIQSSEVLSSTGDKSQSKASSSGFFSLFSRDSIAGSRNSKSSADVASYDVSHFS